jgi:hypothetical protein
MDLVKPEEEVSALLSELARELPAMRGRVYWARPGGAFLLRRSVGFPPAEAPEPVLSPEDPLLERLGRTGPALATSIAVGSRIAGVLELRDKPGGAPFDAEDLRRVETAIGTLVERLERARPDEREDPTAGEAALFLPDLAPPRAPRPVQQRPAAPTARPGRGEVLVYKGFVHALLSNPDLDAVVFSSWARERADLYVGARKPFSESARRDLLRNLESALSAAATQPGSAREKLFNTEFPFGRGDGAIERFAGLQTSVVSAGEAVTLFTLVFAREPRPEAAASLDETHRLVRTTVLEVRAAERYRAAFRSLVSASLEPGRQPYPQLKRHGFAVGLLSRRFAASLRLPAETLEQLTVAGLLHDVGLRELELPYERIAARRPLDIEEMAIVRRHPVVGAALLERISFPYPVAPLVRHHHEWYDGSGYPDRLIAEEIPYGSRLIAIVEAFDAMTAPDSYRTPVSRASALEAIRARAGSQFDPELATRFCAFVRSESAVDRPPPDAVGDFA